MSGEPWRGSFRAGRRGQGRGNNYRSFGGQESGGGQGSRNSSQRTHQQRGQASSFDQQSGNVRSGNSNMRPNVSLGQRPFAMPLDPPVATYTVVNPTPERNDPMMDDAFSVGVTSSLGPDKPKREFSTGAWALPEIVRQVHAEYMAVNSGYAKRVTYQMLWYYATMGWWRRVLTIEMANGRPMTQDQLNFINSAGVGLEMPKPISLFLEGIGNTVTMTGHEFNHRLKAAIEIPSPQGTLGTQGWFGMMNNQTHWKYEDTPCPGIAAWMCSMEVASVAVGYPAFPIAIAPAPIANVQITVSENALGYGSVGILTPDQVQFYLTAGVVAGAFPHVGPYNLNQQLMQKIDAEMRSNSPYPRTPFQIQGQNGTSSQTLLEKICEDQVTPLDNNNLSRQLSAARFEVWSGQKSSDKAVNMQSYSIHRLMKRSTLSSAGVARNTWACACFDNYEAVPAGWTANLNETISGPDSENILNPTFFRNISSQHADSVTIALNAQRGRSAKMKGAR